MKLLNKHPLLHPLPKIPGVVVSLYFTFLGWHPCQVCGGPWAAVDVLKLHHEDGHLSYVVSCRRCYTKSVEILECTPDTLKEAWIAGQALVQLVPEVLREA